MTFVKYSVETDSEGQQLIQVAGYKPGTYETTAPTQDNETPATASSAEPAESAKPAEPAEPDSTAEAGSAVGMTLTAPAKTRSTVQGKAADDDGSVKHVVVDGQPPPKSATEPAKTEVGGCLLLCQ